MRRKSGPRANRRRACHDAPLRRSDFIGRAAAGARVARAERTPRSGAGFFRFVFIPALATAGFDLPVFFRRGGVSALPPGALGPRDRRYHGWLRRNAAVAVGGRGGVRERAKTPDKPRGKPGGNRPRGEPRWPAAGRG